MCRRSVKNRKQHQFVLRKFRFIAYFAAMQRSTKWVCCVCAMLCLLCVKAWSQPVQLPSLFGDDAQNDYLKNSVLKPGEDPTAKIRSLVFIKTSISKKACFVGEPILVIYQLYTAVSCHSRVTKQVSFSGCSVIEMTTDEPEQAEKEGGKIYRVQLIRKVQLIPLQSGDLIIPPATVNNEVGFSTTENPYRQTIYSADVSSESYTVQVAALPDKQPDDFSGITGKFSIEAKTDSSVIAAGENNRLQVTIAGSGNIEAVQEPKIDWPKHTEHFDPTDSQHINRMNFPESGDKTFSFPFISTKQGKMVIPEISFTYFNTDLKKFETVTTKAIRLLITEPVKNKKPIAIAPSLSIEKYIWLVPLIALIVIAVWLIINKNQKKIPQNKPPAAPEEKTEVPEPAPVRPDYGLLLTALSEAEDNKTFFGNAKTLLISALQFTLSPKQDEEAILINLLNNKDEAMAKEADEIMAACNRGLYSPVEDETARHAIVERLHKFFNRLDDLINF